MFRPHTVFGKALSVIVIIVVIYTISILFIISPEVRKDMMVLEEENAHAQLEKLSLIVKKSAKELEQYKEKILEERKEEIKNITGIALGIIARYDEKYRQGDLSLKEAQEEALKDISSMRYNHDDYLFVLDKNYRVIAHPQSALVGKNLSDLKDKYGHLIVKPMVDKAVHQGGGFSRYWWSRAKGGEAVEKLSYAQFFKPWGWIAGTGVYIDDIAKETAEKKQRLISELRPLIEKTKIGRRGYLYILDGSGRIIVHPNHDIEGERSKTLINPTTKHFIYKDLIDAYKHHNGVLRYLWDRPDDRNHYEYDKISWIDYNPYFDWYLCSSAYTDDITMQSNEIIRYIIIISIVMLLVAIMISYILFRKLLHPVSVLTHDAIRVQNGDFTVRSRIGGEDEIGILGRNFNKMLDTIEYHINNLDTQVKEKTCELEAKYRELQSAQAQLVQSEKMVSLGNMIAGISHEINTPIGIAFTGITHNQDELERFENAYRHERLTEKSFQTYIEETRDLNRLIEINLRKASELIRSFKHIAVDQISDENRAFNLKEYIEEILASLRNELKKRKVKIIVDIDDTLTIDSNPGAFSQIMTNFIMNSLIHGFAQEEAGEIRIEAELCGEILHIHYRDNGKGLDEAGRQKIFDPFYTTNRSGGGSGLGMSIVYNLITQKLHGTIELTGTKAQGFEVWIDIPVDAYFSQKSIV